MSASCGIINSIKKAGEKVGLAIETVKETLAELIIKTSSVSQETIPQLTEEERLQLAIDEEQLPQHMRSWHRY